MSNFITRLFKKTAEPVQTEIIDTRAAAREKILTNAQASINWNSSSIMSNVYNGVRYGNISYRPSEKYNYTQMRRNSRGLFQDSTITRNIVARLVDTVINTGLTWESAPIWELISNSPKDEDKKYSITQRFEREWKLYSESKECLSTGLMTFSQLQRHLLMQYIIDGELIGILRYKNAVNRLSPVTVQLIKPRQLMNPSDSKVLRAIESRGGKVHHGVEYDSFGEAIALHIADEFTYKTVRFPFYGTKSNRQFIIYTGNFDDIGQARGIPELAPLVYDLKTIADIDTAELEKTLFASAWAAAIETDKDAVADPSLVKLKSKTDTTQIEVNPGITVEKAGKFALIQNTLEPGQKMNFFSPNIPNSNYEKFVENFTNRIAGALGIPLSVVLEKFQASYSASRAEILFYWMNVDKRRDDIVNGFIKPFHQAWFSEAVSAKIFEDKDFQVEGFKQSKRVRLAWMNGTWNGITMPQIDPKKEVDAIAKRIELGHTTGEREAKAFNGSDYRKNIERLKAENKALAEARRPLEKEKTENNNTPAPVKSKKNDEPEDEE